MAKAFGAPLALLGGGARLVGQFERDSATRMHCSPPSAAAIGAAAHALDSNGRWGDFWRWRLAQRVSSLRRGLACFGLLGARGLFPVQPLHLPANVSAAKVHRRLIDCGVRTVLHRGNPGDARISLVITACHRFSEIDHAVECLAEAVDREPQAARKGAKGNGKPIAAFRKSDPGRLWEFGGDGV
jgi:8-amino-7-oxononanoate synthase